MKDIAHLTVTQYRIFAPDIIPLRPLLTAIGTDAIKTMFHFRSTGLTESGELAFHGGTLKRQDELPIWINVVNINERRLVVQVTGNSEEAAQVCSALIGAFAGIVEGRREELLNSEPAVFTEDTSCVATLDFDWRDLVSVNVPPFVGAIQDILTSDLATPLLKAVSLRFQFGFTETAEFDLRGVTLSDKAFVIEPRADVPLEEHRYYTMSPMGSAQHLMLLETLEAELRKKSRKK